MTKEYQLIRYIPGSGRTEAETLARAGREPERLMFQPGTGMDEGKKIKEMGKKSST